MTTGWRRISPPALAVLDYLEERTSVAFIPPPVHPDYHALPGAAVGGRALGAAPFDGRKLGQDFARVRPPRREFLVLGGMMVGKNDIPSLLHPFRSWENFANAARLLARQARDRLNHQRGTRLIMGNALVARLLYSLNQLAVEIRYQTPSTNSSGTERGLSERLLKPATATSPYGQERASCWRLEESAGAADYAIGCFRKGRVAIRSRPKATPAMDILAGERAQGQIEQDIKSPALWMPSSVMQQPDGHTSVFPHIMLDRAKPGVIAVNSVGTPLRQRSQLVS